MAKLLPRVPTREDTLPSGSRWSVLEHPFIPRKVRLMAATVRVRRTRRWAHPGVPDTTTFPLPEDPRDVPFPLVPVTPVPPRLLRHYPRFPPTVLTTPLGK